MSPAMVTEGQTTCRGITACTLRIASRGKQLSISAVL